VLGIFFDPVDGGSEENDWIKSFLDGYGDRASVDAATKKKIDMTPMNTLNVAGSDMWMYDGSLTTPTCDERVAWTVSSAVQNISQAQLTALSVWTKGTGKDSDDAAIRDSLTTTYWDYLQSNTANTGASNLTGPATSGNNRNVQPLEGRKIFMGKYAEKDSASSVVASFAALAAVSMLAF